MEGGARRVLDSVPAAPTVELAMDTDTFVRLASGRGDPAGSIARERRGHACAATRRSAAPSPSEMNFLF